MGKRTASLSSVVTSKKMTEKKRMSTKGKDKRKSKSETTEATYSNEEDSLHDLETNQTERTDQNELNASEQQSQATESEPNFDLSPQPQDLPEEGEGEAAAPKDDDIDDQSGGWGYFDSPYKRSNNNTSNLPHLDPGQIQPPWMSSPAGSRSYSSWLPTGFNPDASMSTMDFDLPSTFVGDDEDESRMDRFRNDEKQGNGIDNETTCSMEERVSKELGKLGITSTIEIPDDLSIGEMSDMSMGNASYILDLAQQKEKREKVLKEEVLEEAYALYREARKAGHTSEGAFLVILGEVEKKKRKDKKQHYKLQDKRLDEALQEELQLRKSRGEWQEGKGSVQRPSLTRRDSVTAVIEHERELQNLQSSEEIDDDDDDIETEEPEKPTEQEPNTFEFPEEIESEYEWGDADGDDESKEKGDDLVQKKKRTKKKKSKKKKKSSKSEGEEEHNGRKGKKKKSKSDGKLTPLRLDKPESSKSLGSERDGKKSKKKSKSDALLTPLDEREMNSETGEKETLPKPGGQKMKKKSKSEPNISPPKHLKSRSTSSLELEKKDKRGKTRVTDEYELSPTPSKRDSAHSTESSKDSSPENESEKVKKKKKKGKGRKVKKEKKTSKKKSAAANEGVKACNPEENLTPDEKVGLARSVNENTADTDNTSKTSRTSHSGFGSRSPSSPKKVFNAQSNNSRDLESRGPPSPRRSLFSKTKTEANPQHQTQPRRFSGIVSAVFGRRKTTGDGPTTRRRASLFRRNKSMEDLSDPANRLLPIPGSQLQPVVV